MFIRWRTYQRQHRHQKGDKYRLQPILTHSYRLNKKEQNAYGLDGKSRHATVHRFGSFKSCDYVYYDDPEFIHNRLVYWVNMLAHCMQLPKKGVSPQQVRDALDEIDSINPNPFLDERLMELWQNDKTYGQATDNKDVEAVRWCAETEQWPSIMKMLNRHCSAKRV